MNFQGNFLYPATKRHFLFVWILFQNASSHSCLDYGIVYGIDYGIV